MKKSLLTIFTATLSLSAFAQPMPSPDWSTLQNTSFTVSAAGTRFLDAVSANDVWLIGYDGFGFNRNYNWFSVSNNGGSTFTSGNCYSDTNTYKMANLEGVNGTTAWVSAYMKAGQNMGAVHQTTNGGLNWTNMTPVGAYTNSASFVNVVAFVTPSVGIIMGDPVGGDFEIWRTTNGGASFTKVPGANIPNPASGSEYGTVNVYEKYGTNDIWFGTTLNRVYHSTDGGLNWTVSPAITSTLGAAQAIADIAFSDANNGLMTAYFGPSAATASITLWNTTNGGATWTQINTISSGFGYNDFCAIPGSPGWYASVSNGATAAVQFLSYSMDNGVTWNDWGSMNIGYLAIDFVNNTVGWAGTFSSQSIIGTEGIYKYSGIPLGVKNNEARPLAFNLFPNPSNGVFTIKMPPAKEGFVLTVFDVLGKQVYSHSAKTAGFETLSYDLSHLGKGIYSINIAKGNEMSTQKIIIE